ncbi:lactate utilization protein C [Kitasatospora sp. RB6PN24]|uniref:LutC/YkgG family protein n=1 Tax=Kitasatospora humi TaxID=2893891 RepID=UPI001E35F719|nr:lactate utilization protein C [Kitasatospora humi]MCC9309781.1 lactate utilization protein C [Kitasatospora humi]
MTSARDRILAKVRAALADVPPGPPDADPPATRAYRTAHTEATGPALLALLAENLADYRAVVHQTTSARLPELLAEILRAHGSRSVAVPADLPPEWLAATHDMTRLIDSPDLTAEQLNGVDSALTGCALAIAETGTIVLDAGPAQGRRMLTLVPDHHICVIRADQVAASLPQALPRLDPTRPQTWISGPSATSDIELERVEGVHGPRRLEVVVVSGRPQ